MFAAARY